MCIHFSVCTVGVENLDTQGEKCLLRTNLQVKFVKSCFFYFAKTTGYINLKIQQIQQSLTCADSRWAWWLRWRDSPRWAPSRLPRGSAARRGWTSPAGPGWCPRTGLWWWRRRWGGWRETEVVNIDGQSSSQTGGGRRVPLSQAASRLVKMAVKLTGLGDEDNAA